MSVLLTISLMSLAAPLQVEAHVIVEPPVIPFHRQATYTIVVEAPADMEVELPQMVGRFGGLDVYGPPERSMDMLDENRRRIEETYILDPVFAGDYVIEPVTITYGDNETLVVPSPGIRIRDLTEDELEAAMRFEPNAGPVSIDEGLWRPGIFWVGLVLFVILVSGGAACYVVWRRGRAPSSESPPLPWEVAYERLRALDLRQLPQAGEWERYYVELSGILRHYIEDRFQLHAPEQTTPEFLMEAARSGLLSEAHQRLLAGFLRHSDRVKFAQYEPTLDEMERGFAQVLEFVDGTVPKPKPVQEREVA